jgi:hypothetical protein
VQVEALMMAIAAIVPHYLLGIAGGAALLGIFMPVGGFVIAVDDMPKAVWRYPVHYIAYHSYAFHGLMLNEFEGTDGWKCTCTLERDGCTNTQGLPFPECTIPGNDVSSAAPLSYLSAC